LLDAAHIIVEAFLLFAQRLARSRGGFDLQLLGHGGWILLAKITVVGSLIVLKNMVSLRP